MQVSIDGLLCCTISNDHSVKIYDVVNYDMMVMIRLPYVPGAVEWVYKQGEVKARLAISDRNSSFVHIYDARAGSNEPIISKEVLILRLNQIWLAIQNALVFFLQCDISHFTYDLEWFVYFLVQVHLSPIKVMKYNPVYDSVISADAKGLIEYWNPTTLQFPEDE